MILTPPGGDDDAHRQAQFGQIEEHREIIFRQRRDRVVSARDPAGRGQGVRGVHDRVGEGDGELVNLAAPEHVTEIDQARDTVLFGADQDVIVVGVLMNDTASEVRKAARHGLFVAFEYRFDQAPGLGVVDMPDPGIAGRWVIEIPQKLRTQRGWMHEIA